MKPTKKELLATAQVFRLVSKVIALLNKTGASDCPGLVKCVLRTALFFAEEIDLGRSPDPAMVVEMIAMDYREDRKRNNARKSRK